MTAAAARCEKCGSATSPAFGYPEGCSFCHACKHITRPVGFVAAKTCGECGCVLEDDGSCFICESAKASA